MIFWGTQNVDYFWGFYGDTTVFLGGGDDYGYADAHTLVGGNFSYWTYLSDDPSPTAPTPYVFGNDVVFGEGGDDEISGDVRALNDGSSADRDDRLIVLGNDSVFGGDGDDLVIGDGNLSSTRYGSIIPNANGPSETKILGGDDVLSGDNGDDQIYGDGNFIIQTSGSFLPGDEGRVVGQGGDDLADGGSGNDSIYGDSYTVNFRAGVSYGEQVFIGGDDTLNGGTGNDYIVGDAREAISSVVPGQLVDSLRILDSGDDVLNGGDGNDVLIGDFTILWQTGGDNIFHGGDDTLIGGAGDDEMYGDVQIISTSLVEFETGNDVFVFEESSGRDVIHDFEQGQDKIDVSALEIESYDELVSMITYDSVTGHATIDWDGSASALHEVVVHDISAFSADDFIYA